MARGQTIVLPSSGCGQLRLEDPLEEVTTVGSNCVSRRG
jgi:hypothetical protein